MTHENVFLAEFPLTNFVAPVHGMLLNIYLTSTGLPRRGAFLKNRPIALTSQILRVSSRWACTKRRNVETKRPKRNGRNHRNDRNDRNETTETKRPKRNDRNETTETKRPKRNDRNETTETKRPKRNGRNETTETKRPKI